MEVRNSGARAAAVTHASDCEDARKSWMPGWLCDNWAIVGNAASMMATVGANSVLGFLYWWLAARLFPAEAVGLASAGISAMGLLGMIGSLGLNTSMIGELPRRPREAGSLLVTSLVAAGIGGSLLGVLFLLLVRYLSPELWPYRADLVSGLLFVAGVALAGITLVFDDALIGLFRGGYQLGRNMLFALLKLGLLYLAARWLSARSGVSIYATWAAGNLLSLLIIQAWARTQGIRAPMAVPQPQVIGRLVRSSTTHLTLNLTQQGPGMVLPLVVTILLSTAANASFYIAWMITVFVFIAPRALTMVLFAVGSGKPELLAQKARMTVKLSLALGGAAATAVFFTAGPILSVFGSGYALQAAGPLRIMVLALPAVVVKSHFVSVERINGRMARAVPTQALGALLEVGLGTLGGYLGGLLGLSVGWLIAIYIEAAFMLPGLYRGLRSHPPERGARVFPLDDGERFGPTTEARPSTGAPGK